MIAAQMFPAMAEWVIPNVRMANSKQKAAIDTKIALSIWIRLSEEKKVIIVNGSINKKVNVDVMFSI